MSVNTPTAAPMAFFVPSHNAVYDCATQLDGQWVTQREAKTLESLRRLYPDAELIPATLVSGGPAEAEIPRPEETPCRPDRAQYP